MFSRVWLGLGSVWLGLALCRCYSIRAFSIVLARLGLVWRVVRRGLGWFGSVWGGLGFCWQPIAVSKINMLRIFILSKKYNQLSLYNFFGFLNTIGLECYNIQAMR